jgi:hypothetical protein
MSSIMINSLDSQIQFNWYTQTLLPCPPSVQCCRALSSSPSESRGYPVDFNATHYWAAPFENGTFPYTNITAGILVRTSENTTVYLPDCGSAGSVTAMYATEELKSSGSRERRVWWGALVMGLVTSALMYPAV